MASRYGSWDSFAQYIRWSKPPSPPPPIVPRALPRQAIVKVIQSPREVEGRQPPQLRAPCYAVLA
jgi:hypothetical protein